ncbi:MAG: class II aldolase/adducin family protein [Spirochaetaceae bacterium]|jgi:rhamnose utilization protein RhaD (predicted bifunctional aldolase and dehydrogenase)|nr:class II aldolase/adducin family protein [Spirochaetaceae bacterium]
MSLQELVEISRYYGSNPDYVIAGGGNTSWKDGNTLYVKGSGTALGEIDSGGFVRMDRAALARIWTRRYPEDAAEREAAVLADMMAARAPGEAGRPSVETLLHDVLPFLYVVHTHPALVNGVTCSKEGEAAVKRLFDGPENAPPLWIPVINPGYVLSAVVKEEMEGYIKTHGRPPEVIFLQNHGIFVGANSAAGIKEIYRRVMDRIALAVGEAGLALRGNAAATSPGEEDVLSPPEGETLSHHAASLPQQVGDWVRAALAAYYPGGLFVRFDRNNEIARLVQDRASFAAVSSAFTPDHIVYAGSDPLFIEAPQGLPSATCRGGEVGIAYGESATAPLRGEQEAAPQGLSSGATYGESATAPLRGEKEAHSPPRRGAAVLACCATPDLPPRQVAKAVERHVAKTGRPPKVVAVQGVGVYCVGVHQKAADLAYALFLDAAAVAGYTEAFGGPSFMPQDKINFINNWEVERYRSSVSVKETKE